MGLVLAGNDLFGRFAQQLANGNLSLVPPSRSFLPPPALFDPSPNPLPPRRRGTHATPGGGVGARQRSGGGVLPQFLPPPCTTLFCSLESPHATRYHPPRLY
jgi:hypothetical protein